MKITFVIFRCTAANLSGYTTQIFVAELKLLDRLYFTPSTHFELTDKKFLETLMKTRYKKDCSTMVQFYIILEVISY